MIAIGCDHAGYELKKEFITYLKEKNYDFIDLGCADKQIDWDKVEIIRLNS